MSWYTSFFQNTKEMGNCSYLKKFIRIFSLHGHSNKTHYFIYTYCTVEKSFPTLYTVIKRLAVSLPQKGCHFSNSPWSEIIKLFSARESLVGDIPAGDGKTAINFLQYTYVLFSHVFKYVLLYNIYIFEREKADSWSFAFSQVIF